MRVGIIDMGTNTFNLLIAEVDEAGGYQRLYNSKVPVKLGEGGLNEGYINDDAFQRAFLALEAQTAAIRNFYCDRILAFATSAVRSARNGQDFVKAVRERFGVTIQVIDGSEEADYIYHGVQLANAIDDNEIVLIMDIGGGSTEFIIADQEEIQWKQSFELGVSRLLQKFNPSDPITDSELQEIQKYIETETAELFESLQEFHPEILVGSSGSFDTLAEIIANKFYSPDLIGDNPRYDFKREDYDRIHQILLKSTKEDRLQMPGLIKMRVDMIVLASIFIELVLRKSKLQNLRLSSYSLKEGVLFEMLKGNL